MNLTINVIPLVALFALNPFFAVGDLRVTIEVNLFAKVAVLILLESVSAELTEP